MQSIQETYDGLLKAEELLKYAIKHHGKALSALCEIDDHTVNIRNEYHVPSTYNNVGRTENIIEDLNSAAEKYSSPKSQEHHAINATPCAATTSTPASGLD